MDSIWSRLKRIRDAFAQPLEARWLQPGATKFDNPLTSRLTRSFNKGVKDKDKPDIGAHEEHLFSRVLIIAPDEATVEAVAKEKRLRIAEQKKSRQLAAQVKELNARLQESMGTSDDSFHNEKSFKAKSGAMTAKKRRQVNDRG